MSEKQSSESKPNFAKYLPVEGELEDFDIVLLPIHGLYQINGEQDLFKARRLKAPKVKLFLCSRDIQVGDKFRHYLIDPKKSCELRKPVHDFNKLAKEEDICAKVEDGKVWWSRDSPYVTQRVNYATAIEGTFKVIGEISPNAIWVKEGDEFDESEVQYLKKERIAYLTYVFVEGENFDEIEQGEVREYIWKDGNGEDWWKNHDSNPNILSYKGKLYLYGSNGHRKDTLEGLKEYLPQNIRVEIKCLCCNSFK